MQWIAYVRSIAFTMISIEKSRIDKGQIMEYEA